MRKLTKIYEADEENPSSLPDKEETASEKIKRLRDEKIAAAGGNPSGTDGKGKILNKAQQEFEKKKAQQELEKKKVPQKIPVVDKETASVPDDGKLQLSDDENKELDQKFTKYVSEGLLEDKSPTDGTIIKAIKERQYIGIYYKGDESVLPGFRLLECYCYGRGHKSKKKISNKTTLYLRAYVILDTSKDINTKDKFKTKRKSVSKSMSKPFWRMFRVDRIQNWMPLGKTFSSYRSKYNPNDSSMVKIIASLPLSGFPGKLAKGGI